MSGPLTGGDRDHDLAMAFGATVRQADALVDALDAAGVRQRGVVVTAAVAAARWGVEITEAVQRLADGATVPADVSDYELRAAAEEGEADLMDRWRDAVRAGRDDDAHWRRLADAGHLTHGD